MEAEPFLIVYGSVHRHREYVVLSGVYAGAIVPSTHLTSVLIGKDMKRLILSGSWSKIEVIVGFYCPSRPSMLS